MWIALGHTDMRKGMQRQAMLVQQGLKRNPHGGDLFVFRGRAGSLTKIIWYDGIGMSLQAKRLERGRLVWPLAKEGTVSLNPSQLACLLDGIDWRNPQYTWRRRRAQDNRRTSAICPCSMASHVIHSPHGSRDLAPSGRS